MIGAVVGVEERINSIMMTYEISKAPSKSIYIDYNIVTYVKNN